MKYLALLVPLLVVSCASRPNPHVMVRPLPPPAVEPLESVRYAEVVQGYHVGRYVDPNHPLARRSEPVAVADRDVRARTGR